MLLHFGTANILAIKCVVAFLKGEAMIPHEARLAQQCINPPVALTLIEFVLVRYYWLVYKYFVFINTFCKAKSFVFFEKKLYICKERDSSHH